MILSGDCAKHVAASISIKTVDAYLGSLSAPFWA